jgi:SAM-dependent methyltransferase
MIVFTICSKNFFGYALSLRAFLEAHDSSLTFYVALCDSPDDFDSAQFPFRVISIDQLGIPNFEIMRAQYNITELNTSIKPFMFSYLFDRHPGQAIVYLDPDIMAMSPFEELIERLNGGANCVLTPHLLEPAEFAEMDDGKFLVYGIYNLGFCAFRDTPQVRRVISWWGRRLESHCIIDLEHGLFVDQKWADLLPAYIDNTSILRHPGYNVAYWNLSQRRVRLVGDTWMVNGQPLRFFHFSGNKIEDPRVFSRHSSEFNMDNIGDAKLLLDVYRSSVYRHGHLYFSTIPYAFSWNGAGGHNAHTPRSVSEARENVFPEAPYLPLERVKSQAEFMTIRHNFKDIIETRRQTETDAIIIDSDDYMLSGTCACCRRSSTFRVSGNCLSHALADRREQPNWRRTLKCQSCGLASGARALLHIFEQEFAPTPGTAIYVTEHMSPAYRWVKARFKNTYGTDYLVASDSESYVINGSQHQELQGLSFKNDKLEYVLTLDTLENSPDYQRALKEFFRCLAPGGVLLIGTALRDSYEHEVRTERRGGAKIEYLHDSETSPSHFRHFGWRLLDELRDIGFCDVEVLFYWSEQFRYFGDPQLIVVARKSNAELHAQPPAEFRDVRVGSCR